MSNTDPTVVVVDDEPSCLQALAALIRDAGLRVRTFDSERAFRRAFNASWRGCVVLDLHVSPQAGLELHRWLLERGCVLPVVILAGNSEASDPGRSRPEGVETFGNPVQRAHLIRALRAALLIGAPSAATAPPVAPSYSALAELTLREIEVCDCLLEGLSSKQIANQLSLSTRTVEHHRANILRKLGAANTVELVRRVLAARSTRERE